ACTKQIGGGLAAYGLIARELLAVTGDGIVRHLARQKGESRLEHGDVDPLPLACLVALEQRARDAEPGRGARQHIADPEARARRTLFFVTGDSHDAAHRLDLAVVAGARALRTGLTETGDCAVDQPRIDVGQRGIADTELVHHARPKILHHHV